MQINCCREREKQRVNFFINEGLTTGLSAQREGGLFLTELGYGWMDGLINGCWLYVFLKKDAVDFSAASNQSKLIICLSS